MAKVTPCDGIEGVCLYDAQYSRDCEYWCELGVDDQREKLDQLMESLRRENSEY